jgi:hypothetical protein
MVDDDQVLLSDDLLTVMRTAVTYAVEYGARFVAPAHLLLALLDDAKIGDTLRDTLERGRVIAAARQPAPGGVVEIKEGTLPRGEKAPFIRFDSVMFQSMDGQHQRWLNRDAFQIFNESAKRVERGRFLPRHLALGIALESQEDRDVRLLLGREPELFKEIAFALS